PRWENDPGKLGAAPDSLRGGIPLRVWTECILTATYLINRLLSSMLNGKSPNEIIYKKCPTLSYLRVLGYLCFATIVNNNDKFGSRSEKCVTISYSSVKKDIDSDKVKNDTTNVFQDVNHINFFDIEYLEIPNDDERVYPKLNSDNKSQSARSSSLESSRNSFTTDFLVNSENDVDSSDNIFATKDEGVTTLEENIFSEGNRYSNEEHKKAMKTVVDGHFRALVSQLLQVEDLDDTDNWLEIITLLSWEAASLLKPDTSKGGGMDPGGYVKIKFLASGRPSNSMVVKGVVCKKNVAHRRMTSRIKKPRILILEGALKYQ
nr:1-phosphatidylinositol-3-phosphate 5-kinase FAB1B-like [Tanacetum cinerariifolium]